MNRPPGSGLTADQAAPASPHCPDWNTERYARDAGFVPALGRGVLAWLRPKPEELILDLGCGDGTLTVELTAAGAQVVGIDNSPSQIQAAQALLEDVSRRMEPALFDESRGLWWVDYVRLRFEAVKE